MVVRVARGAGRQNVATPARSRVAKKMAGLLIESKKHNAYHNIGLEASPSDHHGDNWIPFPLYRKYWSQVYVIYCHSIHLLMNEFSAIAIKIILKSDLKLSRF